jgi:hypothetical protein
LPHSSLTPYPPPATRVAGPSSRETGTDGGKLGGIAHLVRMPEERDEGFEEFEEFKEFELSRYQTQ